MVNLQTWEFSHLRSVHIRTQFNIELTPTAILLCTPLFTPPSLSLSITLVKMAAAIKKVNMITQIVRLRQVVQRWKTKSLSRRSPSSSSDSDDSGGSPKCRTPSGSLAVYVGPEHSRFVIPTRFLNFPVFVALLEQAEEEFGFQTTGGLVLPCEPGFFSKILRSLDDDEERFRGLTLDDFLNIVADASSGHLSCKESSSSYTFAPLLHKTRV